MNRFSCWLLLVAILVQRGLSVSTASDSPDEDDEEWDEDEDSSEVDDDSRIYKNPRNSPSTECPRDEEQATLLGQKCLRKCSSDEDCKSKKKKCLCDGVCGMSCIKPDRECPEITQPPLGTVTMSGNHFGARATYTCPHGYHVVGLQSRLCQADGHWAGQEPSCKQNIYCLTPPTIEHARHSALPEQATFDLDSNIQYHCHTGYVTAGFPRAKCLAIDGRASWYGPDIQCEPRSCNQPTDPAHGWHAGECYTFGCRITYHCSEGYELVGKVDRLCQADGSWTPKELPTCVLVTAVQCSLPENPKNGKAIYTSCSYNSVLSYECRYGYTLVGESSRRCGADRKWSGSLPVCKEINCGPPGILYNGWLENLEGGTGLGASIIFRCHPGMLLIGNSSSVCQIDGKWRYPVPECLAPCVVPAISQGTVIPMEAVEIDPNITTTFVTPTLTAITNKVKHGTMLEVMCENLYEFPVSSLALPTCSNGTWTIIPRCIPARCKTLPKYPKFGMVLAPKTEHGMKSRFKCKDGYKLTGPGGKEITDPNDYVLTCSFGNWTGETPMCQEVYCSFPGYIPHGKVLLVGNMGLYDYRPYVKKIVNNKQIMYDCDKGYVLGDGPIGATCVGGLWRPTELPSCLLGQHPRLRWTRKRRSVEMKHARSRYIRENWRRLQHKVQELLNHNNLYSKRKPRVEQYNNRSRRNSVESDIAYTKYYAKIRQRYRNYLLGIIRSSRAEEERRKSLSEPSDQNFKYTNISPSYRNDGTQSNDIPEKSVQSKGTYHRDRIRGAVEKQNLLKALIIRRKRSMDTEQGQEKKNNHRNEMNQTLEHQSDQEKGNTEIKKGKPREPCEAIETKSYFTIDIVREGRNPDNKFSAGTIVRIKCANEYKLNLENPNGTAKCVRGNWKPMKPDCILLPCTVPTTEHGTYFHMSSDAKPVPKQLNTFEEIVIDDYIDFQCDNGYNVQGSNRLKCVKGKWDPTPLPECAPAPCILPSINNAVYQEGYRGGLTIAHGSSVNIQCDNPLNNSPVQMVCRLGSLTPASIQCETGSRKSREEYLGEVEFVSAGNHELNSIMHGLTPDRFDSLPIPSSTGKDCGSPSRVDDALVYKNGEPIGETESGFQSGTEITFNCIVGSAGERITWKIICDDGSWVGRSLNCANGTCIFMNNEPNVVTFYNDLQIREDKVEFPPGATIISRCVDIGKFSMTGSSVRTCIHSEWSGQRPTCYGLNQENDYAMEKAPTILFRHQNGPIAQSNDGKLIVYPGTTLHMECLWMRKFGNPKWIAPHNHTNYTEGWVTEVGRDSLLEFRLSITNAKADDSGRFTCQTPARHEHSVDVLIKAVNCPEIPHRRGLKPSTNSTILFTKVLFNCINGNSLIGASEIICSPSGNWSAPLPVCESVECGDIPIGASSNRSAPRVAVLSREVGGRAAFSCKSGFGLRGPSESTCLPTGEWKTPFPTCLEVQCENPGAPANGYVQGSAPYRASDVVQFNCNPEYMMQGQPIIACQDNGRWSGGLPKCVQACSYPGTAIAGRMSLVKFYYAIGESVTFTCDAGLELRGARMLKCLRNGKWSNAIPTCVTGNATNYRDSESK